MALHVRGLIVCLWILGLAACITEERDARGLPPDWRSPGGSTFISADGPGPAPLPPSGAQPGWAEDGGGSGGERTVEEGDIYRVLSDGKIVNFNSYRGLQVIDAADPSSPSILGRLPVWGMPVELYVSGSVAHLLLNGWQGYQGGSGGAVAERSLGGLLLSVDLSDPARPREIARQPIAGTILTSRLSRSPAGDVLYVAAGRWEESQGGGSVSVAPGRWEGGHGGGPASVASFAVSQRGIAPIDTVELDGWIVDITATPRALLVARLSADWQRSTVALIDITRPDGAMVPGAEVEVAGRVASQFNMDLRGKILRVVSNAPGHRTNVLETFDVTDFGAPIPVSNVRFGDGEDLYATLFLDDAAFFVTYFRVDPFHAFSIDEEGLAEEKSEFIVSGWNDFFRPVSSETRLIGIGVDDQQGRRMAVSLYDITDLGNPDPMIVRAHVDSEWSHSEANWDHRAFSVIEGAVDVPAADGTRETGLVLLPYSGWRDGTWRSAVQIFTFSDHSLTRRGSMEHGDHVRRSFQVPAATATLSDEELALFDISAPENPVELGRLELASNQTDVLVFGDHLVRRVDGTSDWWGPHVPFRPGRLEIVSRLGDPGVNRALATLELPYGSLLRKVGRHLLAVVADSTVKVYDLQNPLAPRARGEISISQTGSRPSGGAAGSRAMAVPDCWDCGGSGHRGDDSLLVAGSALVFVSRSVETAVEDRPGDRMIVSTRQSTRIDSVDLQDPDAPAVGPGWTPPDDEVLVGILADGDRIWVSSKKGEPTQDGRSWARYFTRRLDFAPGRLDVGPAINVPGEVFAVQGTTLFTKDQLWSGNRLDSGVARLRVEGGRAVLENHHLFPGVAIGGIFRDRGGHVVLNHSRAYDPWAADQEGPQHMMSILDGGLRLQSELEITPWSTLRAAASSRAFLQVPEGLLVYNLDDASMPWAQAFFPTYGWPSKLLVEGREAMLPAGKYGIHRFGLDEVNLAPPLR